MCNESDMEIPVVPWSELWSEILGLGVAMIIPVVLLVFDLADRNADLFQRGGSIGLFIVAILQFKALTDLNRKHIRNALRAKKGERIQEISEARTSLGWWTLIAAIYSAAIATFGDKFVYALIKVLSV